MKLQHLAHALLFQGFRLEALACRFDGILHGSARIGGEAALEHSEFPGIRRFEHRRYTRSRLGGFHASSSYRPMPGCLRAGKHRLQIEAWEAASLSRPQADRDRALKSAYASCDSE